MESQRAELQAQVHKLADVCWEQCIDRPRDKLDSRTETCVSNCVERFIDTSLTIATRFQKLLQAAADLRLLILANSGDEVLNGNFTITTRGECSFNKNILKNQTGLAGRFSCKSLAFLQMHIGLVCLWLQHKHFK
ncbi:mitochondrial import inner membrane translocase subunit Tim8 [Biomphalaria glabrata]|nr:mitochondrial import inner membrane translocase subunit Tim8 [Biomphalaria glabrata]